MGKFKVVVTDYEYQTFKPEEEVFQKAGIELVLSQCKTEEEIIEAAKDADGLLNQYAPVTRKVIENLPGCKVISRYGVGFNTIDIDAATENKIVVGNVTDYCLDEVSNHAFALLMEGARKVSILNKEVKLGNWDYKAAVPIYRLKGRVLGLVGFGNIPQTLAKKAEGFGLEIIAHDPFVPPSLAAELGVELTGLNELCQRADFISVHAPLNSHTRGMISTEQFATMKKEAFLINTARGPIIDEQALIKALQNNQIAGAALDVLEEEPVSADNPLLKMDNVILTPHASWYSEEAETELKRKTAQNAADVLNGCFPAYLVNKELKKVLSLKEK